MSTPTSNRAFYLPKTGGYKALIIKNIDVPKPKANQVLIKVQAVSLQYRDIAIASGQYPVKRPDNLIPCSDMSGTIHTLGSEVNNSLFSPGDRVCVNFALEHLYGDTSDRIQASALGGPIDGVLTEWICVPSYSVVKIPDHLSFEEASTLPCAGLTAYNALNGPTPIKAGDTVLVQGTGGVSIFALQFATAAGATVIATSSSTKKLEIATKLGAKHVINYKQVENWDEEVMKITKGRGVDHIIEVGGAGTIEKSSRCTRKAGWIHIIGFIAGPAEAKDNFVFTAIRGALMYRGIQIGSVAQFEDMNRLITASLIHPVVDKVFSFEDAIQAYEYLESQKHVGKVVIRVGRD